MGGGLERVWWLCVFRCASAAENGNLESMSEYADVDLRARIREFIKETTRSNSVDMKMIWAAGCFVDAKYASVERAGQKDWFFYNFALEEMSDNNFFDYIVLTVVDARTEQMGANEWWFQHNGLKFVIKLDYPPYVDRHYVSREGDMCWKMSATPLQE